MTEKGVLLMYYSKDGRVQRGGEPRGMYLLEKG